MIEFVEMFLIGVVIGYLINKITSLLALVLLVFLVVSVFFWHHGDNGFSGHFEIVSSLSDFFKSHIQNAPEVFKQSPISKYIDFKSINFIVFLAGVVTGFKIG